MESEDRNRQDDVQNSTGAPERNARDTTRGEGSGRPNPDSEKVDTTGGGEPIPGADSIDGGVQLPDNVAEESVGNDTTSGEASTPQG